MTVIDKEKMRIVHSEYLDFDYVKTLFFDKAIEYAKSIIEDEEVEFKSAYQDFLDYSLTEEDKYEILEQIMIDYETKDFEDIDDNVLIASAVETWIEENFHIEITC